MNLVVDEMTELVQKADRGTAAYARNTQVDRILLAVPVSTGLADRRRESNGDGLEVGAQRVQARRRC